MIKGLPKQENVNCEVEKVNRKKPLHMQLKLLRSKRDGNDATESQKSREKKTHDLLFLRAKM